MKNYTIVLLLCTLFCTNTRAQSQHLSLDKGWKFYLGDIPMPVIKSHTESYASAKAGKAWGAAAPEYNDNNWRKVTLPHDWAIEGKVDSTENVSQGYYKRGIGWYRRTFKLDAADKGKFLELQFDGIATHCTIWFNGNIVQRNWSGYNSFYIDITSMAKYGDDSNTIAIRVDANAMEGWWYEGAGIYRHTWLSKRAPINIQTDGIYANPVKKTSNNWTIPVEVALQNSGKKEETVEVESALYDKSNKLIAKNATQLKSEVLKLNKANFTLDVTNPVLWSIENPVLYKVITQVKLSGKIIAERTTKCGFRTLRFEADSGFYLNDKPVKIKGVCNHQDHAGVGVAMPDALWEFRIRKLKELGANAYRCSHHAPSNELLNVCDSLGLLVMDEARNFNVSEDYMKQLEWMVKRDRNHPSIFMWSVFNEEPIQATSQGYEMVRRMSAKVKEYDTTRPITAAMNGGMFAAENVSQAVDVVGFNYRQEDYDKFHKLNPSMKMTSSEDTSAFQNRGEYVTDAKKNTFDSYDTHAAPWGATYRSGWKTQSERPFLAGGFIWTGFDYHGEPTPYSWPSVSSVFGIMDLCGFPKMAYWLRQAQWRNDINVLQLVPHWNWPKDSIGKNIKVMSLTNADEVKLILNGKTISTQKVDRYEMNTWEVPYQPGKLEAIGYKNGKEISRFKVETTGNPVSLQLIPDRNTINGDGTDAVPITVKALDAKGREVPTANFMVHFNTNKNAAIIGLGNGDSNSHELEKGNKRSLYNGLAQVIIQSNENTEGFIELTATADGMKSATVKIPIVKLAPKPFVEEVSSAIVLSSWVQNQITESKPNPKFEIADNDMNTWSPITPGELTKFDNANYSMYTTSFTLNGIEGSKKGTINFKKLTGKAEIWVNNILIGTKTEYTAADYSVSFSSTNGKHKLTVLIESEKNKQGGLGGTISLIPEN
jgi:beta-galactosidase